MSNKEMERVIGEDYYKGRRKKHTDALSISVELLTTPKRLKYRKANEVVMIQTQCRHLNISSMHYFQGVLAI